MLWNEILRKHIITKDEARSRIAKIREMCPEDRNVLLHEVMHILMCVDFGDRPNREDIAAFRKELLDGLPN